MFTPKPASKQYFQCPFQDKNHFSPKPNGLKQTKLIGSCPARSGDGSEQIVVLFQVPFSAQEPLFKRKKNRQIEKKKKTMIKISLIAEGLWLVEATGEKK